MSNDPIRELRQLDGERAEKTKTILRMFDSELAEAEAHIRNGMLLEARQLLHRVRGAIKQIVY